MLHPYHKIAISLQGTPIILCSTPQNLRLPSLMAEKEGVNPAISVLAHLRIPQQSL